jgi:hypothetical protein
MRQTFGSMYRRSSGVWVPRSGSEPEPPAATDAAADAHSGVYCHAGIGAFNYPINAADDYFSMVFAPAYTGTLSRIYIYCKTAPGYGAGTFGSWNVAIRSFGVDGSAGSTLGEEEFTISSRIDPSLFVYADVDASVTAGTAYHAYLTNTDASPGTNWASINLCHVRRISGSNDSLVTAAGDLTHHGLDPRGVNIGDGTYGVPRDGDGWTIPAYWLVFSDGHEEGQPYYNASPTAFSVPTSRTYTVPYDCVARNLLAHGSGRVSAGQGSAISYTATVAVNGDTVASGLTVAGTHDIVVDLGIGDLELLEGDSVTITASNTTGVCAPYLDAAIMTLTGLPRSLLPACLIG